MKTDDGFELYKPVDDPFLFRTVKIAHYESDGCAGLGPINPRHQPIEIPPDPAPARKSSGEFELCKSAQPTGDPFAGLGDTYLHLRDEPGTAFEIQKSSRPLHDPCAGLGPVKDDFSGFRAPADEEEEERTFNKASRKSFQVGDRVRLNSTGGNLRLALLTAIEPLNGGQYYVKAKFLSGSGSVCGFYRHSELSAA